MVCFNCRKPGHGVADCPEKTAGMGANIKARVCFICGDKRHRALKCPNNPRGLYPEGGGCKFCGDVTHLYAACPKKLGQKESEAKGEVISTFDPFENTELEMFDRKQKIKISVKKKKIVKF